MTLLQHELTDFKVNAFQNNEFHEVTKADIRWRETDAGRPVGGRIVPVSGGFRTVEGLWTYWLFQ